MKLADCENSDTDNAHSWTELPAGHYEDPPRTPVQINYVDIHSDKRITEQCDRQIFLPFNIGQSRTGKLIGLFDTGADINLITVDYLSTHVRDWEKFEDCQTNSHIKSVTGDTVKILANKYIPIKLDKCAPVSIPFAILQEDLPVKCIFGRPVLAQLKASLLYYDTHQQKPGEGCNKHYYMLKVKHPRSQLLPLLHLSMPGLFRVTAQQITLPPRDVTMVNFQLKINPFLTGDSHCVINVDETLPQGIVTLDTRCQPSFKKNGLLEFAGTFVNDTDEPVKLTTCSGLMEDARGYDAMVSIVRKPCYTSHFSENDEDSFNQPATEGSQEESLPTSQQDAGHHQKIYLVSSINHGPDKRYRKFHSKFKTVDSDQGLKFPHYHCNSEPCDKVFQCCSIQLSNEQFPAEEPYMTAEELLEEEILPSLSLPPRLPTAEEVVSKTLDREDELIQPYLRKLFIEKYPAIVGTHNLDTGPVRYLGRIVLRTKPGMSLPRSSKVYPMNMPDQQHMGDILDFMRKYDFISETYQDDPTRPSKPWGASAFLIKRKHVPGLPNSGAPGFGRLIIDYKSGGLNNVLQETPALVRSIEACLEELRGNYLFTLLDLKQSYYGLCLDPKSYALTQFVVFPGRSFIWHRLPMGISTAPASLLEKCNLMLNYVPKRDEHNNVLYEPGEDPTDEASRAQLQPDQVKNCINFYDDLLVYSKKSKKKESEKNEKSMEEHFCYVEKLVARMTLYGFKITYHKCVWGKRYVDFLGWRVQDDVLYADEKRIEKVRKFDYPKSRKMLQSFLGLVNTLKRVSPLRTGEYLAILSEPSSSKKAFVFTDEHKAAFDQVKKALTEEPLYCSLVDPTADKIIFSDSSSLAFGSVLLSRIKDSNTSTFQSHIHEKDPDCLNQVIRKWNIQSYIGEKYGREEDSFFKAILFLIRYHKLRYQFKDTLELRHAVIKFVKETFIGRQIKEQFCHGDSQTFHHMLHSSIGNLKSKVSARDVVILMMASFLGRGINVVRADPQAKKCPLEEILPDLKSTAIPLTLGAYPQGKHTTACEFVPLLDFKAWEFNPELLNSKYVVNFYDSRIVPQEQRDKTILELESTALLVALRKYRSYITNCRTHVVTDSRSLYYLFSNAITQSHAKVSRYNLKLQADYANVQVLWCSTYDNISDIFSRFGLEDQYETKIKFTAAKVEKLPYIPDGMTFSWENWENVVRAHPQALDILMDYSKTYKTKDVKKLGKIREVYHPTADQQNCKMATQTLQQTAQVCATQVHRNWANDQIHADIKAECKPLELESFEDTVYKQVRYTQASNRQLEYLIKPIKLLRRRMNKQNVQQEQVKFLPELRAKLLKSENYECIESKVPYQLIDGIIYCAINSMNPRIALPANMEMLCLAYIHLAYGHCSPEKMQKTVEYAYHFPSGNLYRKVRLFTATCTACSVTSRNTTKLALRHLSISPDTPPFSIICIDLAENLTKFLIYFEHMLIVKCLTTGYTLLFPLKSKQGPEVYYSLKFGVFQTFGLPEKIYSDNAQIFRSKQMQKVMKQLGIELKDTTPLDSKSRGYIERTVRSVKQGIKKHLHTQAQPGCRVDIYPLITVLNLNLNYNSRTGNSPSKLVFGRSINTNGLFSVEPEQHSSPFIPNGHENVSSIAKVIKEQNQHVQTFVQKAQARADKSVKRPVEKNFPPGTLIYLLNQGLGSSGVSKAWASYYLPSLYVVTQEFQTAIIAVRLSDNQTICRSKNFAKRVMFWPRFQELPQDIKRLLVLNYDQLDQHGLEKLAYSDTFGPLPACTLQNDTILEKLEDAFCSDNEVISSSSDDSSDSEPDKPLYASDSDSDTETGPRFLFRNGRRVYFQ